MPELRKNWNKCCVSKCIPASGNFILSPGFFSGIALDWCQFWLWNGDLWVLEYLPSAWLSKNHGCTHSPGPFEEQQIPQENQEKAQNSLLDWSLSGDKPFLPFLSLLFISWYLSTTGYFLVVYPQKKNCSAHVLEIYFTSPRNSLTPGNLLRLPPPPSPPSLPPNNSLVGG